MMWSRAGWCVSAMLLSSLLATAIGCSQADTRPFRDDSRDPARYAERMKNIVLESVRAFPSDPDPQDIADGLVIELEQYPEQPVGDFEGTYAEMLRIATELQEHFRGGGDSAAVQGLLEELSQLAETLPGDLWD